MARIPTYTSQGNIQSRPEVPALGTEAAQHLNGAMNALTQYAAKKQEDIDMTAAVEMDMQAYEQISSFEQKMKETRLGGKAKGVFKDAETEWQAIQSKIMESAEGENQKKHATALLAKTKQSFFNSVVSFEADQTRAHNINSRLAASKLYGDYALEAAKAEDASLHLKAAISTAQDAARLQGKNSAAELEVVKQGIVANFHQNKFDRLVAAGEGGAAKAYLQRNKQHMDKSLYDDNMKAMGVASTLEQSQSAFDQINAKGGSYEDQLKAARSLKDPKVRQQVVSLIDGEQARVEKRQQDHKDAVTNDLWGLAIRGEFAAATPEQLKVLDETLIEKMRQKSLDVIRGVPDESDPEVYNKIALMPPEHLAKINLLDAEYLTGLSDADRKKFTERKSAILNHNPKITSAMRTRQQIASQALSAAKIKSKMDIKQFNDALDAEILSWEQENKKKAPSEVIQKFADRLLIERKTSYFDDLSDLRLYEITVDEIEDRASLEALFYAHKNEPTDEKLVDAYRARVAGDIDEFKKIVGIE